MAVESVPTIITPDRTWMNRAPLEPVFITGQSNPNLADAVGNILGVRVHRATGGFFRDGSPDVRIRTTLRNRDVFVIQSPSPPHVNDYFEELKDMLDAAKRVGAGKITAVVPNFPFDRSDRMNRERAPISAGKAAVELVEAGADHILTIDLHSEQTMGSLQGIYKRPWDNVYSSHCTVAEIRKRQLENILVASPDVGGTERAFKVNDFINPNGDIGIFFKRRDPATRRPTVHGCVGDVRGKNVVYVDDKLDTGGTLFGAADYAMQIGAASTRAVIAHGLFTADSIDRLDRSPIAEIITTDTINHRPEVANHPKITVVSVAPLLAEAIRRIYTGESIKDLFLSTRR